MKNKTKSKIFHFDLYDNVKKNITSLTITTSKVLTGTSFNPMHLITSL